MRQLLGELHQAPTRATVVYCDNVSAMYMSTNPVQHQRTKHVEIDLHFVRERVSLGEFASSMSRRAPSLPTSSPRGYGRASSSTSGPTSTFGSPTFRLRGAVGSLLHDLMDNGLDQVLRIVQEVRALRAHVHHACMTCSATAIVHDLSLTPLYLSACINNLARYEYMCA